MKLIECVLATVAAVCICASASSAELVTNGDFETGDLTGWEFTPDPLSETKMFTNILPFMESQAFRVNPGTRFAFTDREAGGILSQSIPLVAGRSYQVSVGVMAIQNFGGINNSDGGTITVSLGGTLLHTFDVGGILWNQTLTDTFSGNFEPLITGDAMLELHFTRSARNTGPAIVHFVDDISVVPEPATVVLWGLFTVSALSRRMNSGS